MSKCITHHYACDCRETRVAELIEAAKRTTPALREAADFYHLPTLAIIARNLEKAIEAVK